MKKLFKDLFGDNIEDKVKKFYNDALTGVKKGVNTATNYAQEHFYKDGKLDTGKITDALKHEADAVKLYGEKAVNKMKEIAGKAAGAADDLLQDYQLFNDEDRKRTGFGTRYEGILFHKDYQESIEFLKKADSRIDGFEYKGKNVILDDIKESASSTPQELVSFYDKILHGKIDPIIKEKRDKVRFYFELY